MSFERQRTERVLPHSINKAAVTKLKSLMADKGLLSRLIGYQGTARGFSPSELAREIETHQTLKVLYPMLKPVLNALNLSQGNMKYYASLVKHRSVYKLRRTPKWQGLLYLICFVFFRYRENNDKLVTAFRYLVNTHNQAAKSYAQQKISQDLETVRNRLQDAGRLLNLFIDDNLDDSMSFGDVRQTAFSVINSDDIRKITQHLNKQDFDVVAYLWQYTDEQARKTANTLRKLFLSMDIECDVSQPLLAEQLSYAKSELSQESKIQTTIQDLILKKDKKYLAEDEQNYSQRFEFYLYQMVVRMLEKGRVYITESEKNKRLEDDLIPVNTWNKERAHILEKTGLERLNLPIDTTLVKLEAHLNNLIQQVTANINENANDFVKCQPRSNRLTWSLANRRWKSNIDNPVYSQLRHMGIIDVMSYVNQKTNYLSAFERLSSSNNPHTEAREEDLIACLFGNGANYGLHKIASVSDRSVGALRSVNESYVRPETIHEANDIISNCTSKLPIFKYYTINESAPFGSIDGQKHGCRINTFKARFSAKYFRKGKGVSAMTLVVNHVPVNTTINALNEYEAHFAFDLLYNNSSDIQPKSVATDTHGVNNVNFAILDIFGYQFAPRYARFKRIFEDMFDITLEEELHLSLKKPIKHQLIIEEWERIQHIICSLSRKSTNQSTVIQKLSNNKRNTRTLSALREHDRLIKSIYLLEYVDNQTLRQFVHQALNRGEAYHQLRRAIASVNGNQFRGGSDYEVEQWNDCARLIANCIIYYNSTLLSGLVEKFEEQNNDEAVNILTNLSPVAWSHIQLGGHYTFAQEQDTLNLASLLEHVDPLAETESN